MWHPNDVDMIWKSECILNSLLIQIWIQYLTFWNKGPQLNILPWAFICTPECFLIFFCLLINTCNLYMWKCVEYIWMTEVGFCKLLTQFFLVEHAYYHIFKTYISFLKYLRFQISFNIFNLIIYNLWLWSHIKQIKFLKMIK